jgi:hypothetical protein
MTDAQTLRLGGLSQFESRARVSGCTAALLNAEWAISAAHCINLEDEARVYLVYKVDGVDQGVFGTAYRVLSGDGGYDDVMIIQFDNPITGNSAWVAPYDSFNEYEQLGWQVGLGTSGELGDSSTQKSDGRFRAMTQRIISTRRETIDGPGSSVIPQHLFYNYNGSPEESPQRDYVTRFEGGTGPGDSGGPLYVFSRGRFFNASVVSGPQDGSYRNARLSTHLETIVERSGLEFAYPQALMPKAVWVAEDLSASLQDGATVPSWVDRLSGLSFSNSHDGGMGAPIFKDDRTPTGLSAVTFDGSDALGLSSTENPFAGASAMSVVMVLRDNAGGAGLETLDFGTMGLLDASVGDRSWGLSYAANGRYGFSIEADDASVRSLFRGGADNGSLADGQWHVVVATWDGSEILNDNAGDDRNMKLYVDSVDQIRTGQGAYHFNTARKAVSLLLGKSQTNAELGFMGDIAEIRLYTGELQMHEVDRLLGALKARYVSGQPGAVFERPWSDSIEVAAGHDLTFRGMLVGGATSSAWEVVAGPAPVTFSDYASPNTDVIFESSGSYHLRLMALGGPVSGHKDFFIDVFAPGAESDDMTARTVDGNWMSSDIGDSATGGGFSENAGQYLVTGAGVGLGSEEGETYDHGQFTWKAVAGDFNWSARVSSIGDDAGPTRAGLMVRGGAGPTDAAVFIGYAPDGKLYWMGRRDGGWWGDLVVEETPAASLPAYVKIERRGANLAVFVSVDGISYSQVGDFDVALPGVARVGFFVTSGNAGSPIMAAFDNLSLLQIGYAGASTVSLNANNSSPGVIEYDPDLVGTDEPWLRAIQESGPNSLNFLKTFKGNREVLRSVAPVAGAYQTRLSIDDGNLISYRSFKETVVFNTRYDFEIDDDAEGWSANNVSGLDTMSGHLVGTADSSDPQVIRTGLSLPGAGHSQVTVRMRSSFDGPVQFYWGRAGVPGFSASRVLSLDYSGGSGYQTLVFDMDGVDEWDGETITSLRIDPANGAGVSGATFEIDFIEISDGSALPDRQIITSFDLNADFGGWTPAKHLEGAYVLGGRLAATSSGIDPILTRDVEDFSADPIEALLVRIKSSKAGSLQFFWATSVAPGFAGERSTNVSIAGTGDWETVRLPLSGNPEWDGAFITNLRLDPINQDAAEIEIDAIVLSTGDADGDGMPDSFESLNGLDGLIDDSAEDLDSDGSLNGEEYIFGTAPNVATERFQLSGQQLTEAGFELTFPGVSERLYVLVRKLSLADSVWVPVDSFGPLGSDQMVSLTDTGIHNQAFYEIEVSIP